MSKEVIAVLGEVLADSYVLYLKTQNFHWNVQDARFFMLHAMFQEQYEELAEAVDALAEQVRMLDGRPPSTMKEFLKLTRLKEGTGKETGSVMVKKLADDHQTLVDYLPEMIALSQEEGDEGTADLLIERLRVHQKAAWILKSHK